MALGSTMFVDMANRLTGHDGAVHVVAYVVSGIGFLGAGVIMREEGNVRGINIAATLWGSAAGGASAGADLILEAALGTLFVLAANTLLRPVVNQINRRPLDVASVEVTNTVYVVASRDRQKEALAYLEQAFEESSYPVRDLAIHAFGDAEVEIEATLMATSIDSAVMDELMRKLTTESYINQAFWSPSTSE